MSTTRCKVGDLGNVIENILDEYANGIQEGTQKAVKEVAKIAKEEVKAASPVRKYGGRKGRYKKGWTIKEETVNRFRADVIVHNRTDYQLTHLLEKGHVLIRGGRNCGRVSARVHIAPAEEHAIRNLEEAIGKIAEGRNS